VSRSADGRPIWARPEPSGRRPALSRERIAAAALQIADTEGFDAVSMRRVAAALGTGAMTLYNYVRTKDELVALMDDALMAETVVPDGELPAGWRDALTAIARRTRAVLARHPWALASLRQATPGPNAMRHFEQCLAALSGTGLDTPAKYDLLSLVDDYVAGNVLRAAESGARAATDPDAVRGAIEFGLAQLRTGRYPHTAALLGDLDLTTTPDPADLADRAGPPLDEPALTAQFERGLRALLDGATTHHGTE
jgi:AcrR family transcriptional regulator